MTNKGADSRLMIQEEHVMTKKILQKIIRAAITIAAIAPIASHATAYTPANFGNAEEILNKQIILPTSLGEGVKTVAVHCQADVMATGNIKTVTCYENSPLMSMQNATESALKSATFTPATIDGKAVPVRMQMRVIYSLKGTQAPIILLPNMGTLQAQHGTHHFAPQERLDTNDWYENYTSKERGDGGLFFAEGKISRVMANIDANGDVETVNILEAALRKQADASSIERSLKKSKFIPGFAQDKPTAMHYIAVVNYQK
jgi:hypothetical protein